MKNQITKTTLAAAIALTVVACGPSGSGGLAGIGGSGYVSSGSVTGFGSVFVNGVEFETDEAIFDVDGVSGTQDDLAIGMIVKVAGSINANGVSGTATSIIFDDELQGPVSGIQGTYDVKRSFSVLGITVIMDSGSTTFDVSGDIIVPPTTFDFDTIRDNNNVEISGFFDSSGNLQATRVELKEIDFVENSSIVEVKGITANVNIGDRSFNLGSDPGSLFVDALDATLEDLPNDELLNNQLVEVKGTFTTITNTIKATKVEAEDDSIDDTNEFELEGLISGYVNKNTIFNIGNISVDASKATFEPTTLVLKDNLRVEAEGAIVDGVLIATEIELEGGEIRIHTDVTFVDPGSSTFTVTPVSGQDAITITVTTDTQLENDVIEIEPFTLNNLKAGDFVEVQGFENDSNGITATEVEVKELSDVVVQGYATAAEGTATAGGTMTVLGLEFNFGDRDTTDFEDENDDPMGTAEINDLIAAIATTPQLVKIQDNNDLGDPADGIADEIDLE